MPSCRDYYPTLAIFAFAPENILLSRPAAAVEKNLRAWYQVSWQIDYNVGRSILRLAFDQKRAPEITVFVLQYESQRVCSTSRFITHPYSLRTPWWWWWWWWLLLPYASLPSSRYTRVSHPPCFQTWTTA